MNSNVIESLTKSLSVLKLKITTDEVADFMIEKEYSDTQMQSIAEFFPNLQQEKKMLP